jgi:hypothetical protein
MLSTRRVIAAGIAFVLIFAIFFFPAFTQAMVLSGGSVLPFKSAILYVNDINSTETDSMNKKSLVSDTSFIQQSAGKDQGILRVTVKIVNNPVQLTPSDVRVTIHGNDPIPSSFRGNISGTLVRLHMGMYSATAIGPAGYAPVFSGDCSGGIMSIEIKKCVITDRPR